MCAILKQSSSRAHVIFRTFLDPAPFSLQHERHSDLFLPALSLSEDKSQRTATRTLLWPFSPTRSRSQLPPPRGDHQTLNAQAAGLFGRLAIQCPLTGYKPNAIVEIGSAEVTSIHRPSRRTSFCSVYNSGEDVTSARVSSEVDERQSIERLVPAAAHAEERSKCNPCENLSLCMRIFHVTLITHSKHGENCCNTLTQTEVEQRHK